MNNAYRCGVPEHWKGRLYADQLDDAFHVAGAGEQVHRLHFGGLIPMFRHPACIPGGGGGIAAHHDPVWRGAICTIACRVARSQPLRGGSTTITSGCCPSAASWAAAAPASWQRKSAFRGADPDGPPWLWRPPPPGARSPRPTACGSPAAWKARWYPCRSTGPAENLPAAGRHSCGPAHTEFPLRLC